MISDRELKDIIKDVVAKAIGQHDQGSPSVASTASRATVDSGSIPDIGLIDYREKILVDNPEHPEELRRIRRATPARIAVGRCGTRYKTETMLRFRADHATAQDAVTTDVSEELLKRVNLDLVKTRCKDKTEFIIRPDLGRQFDDDQMAIIKKKVEPDARVLIYVADGLSSTAIEANVESILPMMIDGLKAKGIKVATPFFVKYGRVGAMDTIGSAIPSLDLICVLIGERPGLTTAESMSAYFAYKPHIDMSEARRTVISNIHRGGTPSVEAGAHLVDLIKNSLDNKASGLDLK